ncbi:hypothetical protein RHI63_09865 [Thermosynechococcus sp. GLH187]|uniref:hypothetical protein n=1 Tax=unclassified Thermosynechococcus TaxID=2622553 RepID=UPI0028780376|nr:MULTISPECIES: hypothetical protein [unclassified Thermosynechococcus]WNC44540.1 hypothetical protein RHI63_09865 [Thermosynechococcus sp. GLH187]WNC47076.1 hypothetical protein RHI71_09865 [Thermosynechococcus sp. GLH333]WNC49613.1 hypothetical protein RHI73_09865 [Thermosynechococcus sp. GLH87]
MMSLTPMTRYYIRRLLAKRAESLGLTVSGAESDSQAFADQLARLESLAATKLAEIDLIVRMHQTLSRNGQTYNSYLANLEQKLFALMGLGGQPREELTDITLPQLEETKGAAAKALTLAEVLEHFNKIGDNDGRVVCQSYQSTRDVFLSEEQLEHLQGWLEAFIRQCQRVLPQFTKQLQKAGVPETVLA